MTAADRLKIPYGYVAAREDGMPHAEAMELISKIDAYGLMYFLSAYKAGATHAEILDAIEREIDSYFYCHARNVGITHAEIVEVDEAKVYLPGYIYIRESSDRITHAEAVDVAKSAPGRRAANRYVDLRCVLGKTHQEALESLRREK